MEETDALRQAVFPQIHGVSVSVSVLTVAGGRRKLLAAQSRRWTLGEAAGAWPRNERLFNGQPDTHGRLPAGQGSHAGPSEAQVILLPPKDAGSVLPACVAVAPRRLLIGAEGAPGAPKTPCAT